MKKTFKFSCKAARDNFVKDLKDEHSILSDTEVEISLGEMKDGKDLDEKIYSAMSGMYREIHSYMDYLERRFNAELDYVYSMYSKHMQGHVPAIASAELMQRYLEKTGLDKEYDVAKRTVYASTSKDTKGNVLLDVTRKDV